jgi:hypothetical protein
MGSYIMVAGASLALMLKWREAPSNHEFNCASFEAACGGTSG